MFMAKQLRRLWSGGQLGSTACSVIGACCAIFALSPWLITGMRLPLQNLWATNTLPGDMPFALLPFNQYALGSLTGLIILPYALISLLIRVLESQRVRVNGQIMAATVATFQLFAIIQSTIVVLNGVQRNRAGRAYVGIMFSALVLMVLCGLVVYWLLRRPGHPTGMVGVAIIAAPLVSWLTSFTRVTIFPTIGLPSYFRNLWGPLQITASGIWLIVLGLIPAIMIGAAIGIIGVRTLAAKLVALLALFLGWLIPGFYALVAMVEGNRVYWGMPGESVAAGVAAFRSQLFSVELSLIPAIISLLIAGIIIGVKALSRNRPDAEVTQSISEG